jgi:hypothetical protein
MRKWAKPSPLGVLRGSGGFSYSIAYSPFLRMVVFACTVHRVARRIRFALSSGISPLGVTFFVVPGRLFSGEVGSPVGFCSRGSLVMALSFWELASSTCERDGVVCCPRIQPVYTGKRGTAPVAVREHL